MKKTKSQVLREIASQEKLKKIKSKSNFDEKIKKLKKSTSFKNYQNSKSRPKKKRKKSTEKIYTNFHHLTNELTEESEAFSTFDQRKKDSIYGGMPRLNISSTFQSMESNMAIPPNTGITKAQQLVNGGVIFEDFNEDVESSKRKNSSKSRLIQNMSYLTDQDRAERGKISELYTNAKNYDLGSFYHNEKDVPNVANHVTFKQKMRMLENKKFQEQVFKEKKKKRIERSKDFIIEKRIQHNDIFNEVQVKKVNGKSRSKRSRVSLEPNEDSSILFNFMKKVDHLTKSSLDMNYSVDNKSYEENLISMKRSLISKSKDERSSRVKKVKENEYKSNQDLSNVEEIQKESFNFGINGNNKNSLKIGELYETFNKETSHQKIMKKLMPSELSSIGKQFEDTFLDQKKLQNNSLVKLNSQFLGMLGQENSINKSFRDLKEMLDFEYSDLKSSNKEPRNRSRLNSASSRRKRSSSRSKENNKNLKSNLFSRTLLFQDDIKDISSKEINKLISRKNRARSKRSIVDKPNISPLKKQPLTSTRKGGEISERTKMKMLIENDIDYPDRKRKVKNYDIESPFEDIKTKQKPSYTNEETQDSLQAIKNNLSKNQTFIQKKENVDIYKTSREPTPTYSVHLERKFGKEKRGKSRKKKDKSMKKNRSRKVLWSKVMGAVERLSKPRSKPNSKVSSSRKRQSNNSSKRSISRLEKTESIQNVKLKNSFDKVSIRSKKLKEKTKKKGKQFRKKSSNKRRKSSKKKNLSRISSTGSLRKKSIQSKRRRSTSTSKKKVVKMNKEHHRSKTFSFAKQEKKFQIQNTETTKIESASPTEENDTFDDEIKPVVSSFLRLNPPNDGMFSNKIIFDNIHNVEFDAQPVEIIPNPGKSDDKNTTSFNFSELKKELLGFVNPETFETKIQNSDADKISLNHGVMRERIDSAFTFGQGGEKQLSPTEKEKNPLVKKSTFGPQNSKLMADSLGFNSYRSIEEEIFKGEYTEITSTLEISNKNHFLKKIETTQKIITKSTENIITPEESVNRASISIPYSEDFTDNFSVSYSFDPNEGLSRRGTLKGFAPSEISKNDERTSSASKNRNSFHVSNLSKTLKRQSMKSSVSSQITGFRGTEGSFDPNEVNTVDDEDDEGRCSENGEIEIGNKKLSEDTPNNLSVRKAAYVSGNGQQRHSVNISPMKFSGSQSKVNFLIFFKGLLKLRMKLLLAQKIIKLRVMRAGELLIGRIMMRRMLWISMDLRKMSFSIFSK